MILSLLLMILVFGPTLWLNFVFNRHDKVLVDMPFTASEFGQDVLQEKGLDRVQIEETNGGDHYDVKENKVRIAKQRLSRKSLTAISIVCHEIGHAIQHAEKYEPLKQRTLIVERTAWITRLGSAILFLGLPTIYATGLYSLIKVCLFLVILSAIIGLVIHLITLDVELDASFKRALPILKEKVPAEYHVACRSVLRAAALTYVVGVIGNLFSLRAIGLLISRLT
ncbi:MAG: zinc metallopeptidase [Cellvibrionales bacterium TMED148]|nr:hypothetical protein [Porticoccaceae bacterium]RPG93372.1 MAG: zinc metallopeptidase [Cellvibrionales bacterium TMED148]